MQLVHAANCRKLQKRIARHQCGEIMPDLQGLVIKQESALKAAFGRTPGNSAAAARSRMLMGKVTNLHLDAQREAQLLPASNRQEAPCDPGTGFAALWRSTAGR